VQGRDIIWYRKIWGIALVVLFAPYFIAYWLLTRNEPTSSWYRSPLGGALTTVFLPFVGIWLIWTRKKSWSGAKKGLVTAILLPFVLFTISIPFAEAEPTTNRVANTSGTTKVVSKTETQTKSNPLYAVSKVTDGDTIEVMTDGKTEKIRLIGIDTPETVDPRKTVECYGREASDKAKALLAGKKVRLEADKTQGDKDKYSRLLRYVFLEDGTNFNLLMIKEGYATEYTYNSPYRYQKEFKEAQRAASDADKGLWSPETCNGTKTAVVKEQPAPAPQVQQPAPVAVPAPAPAPASGGVVKMSSSGICHAPGTTYYNRTTNFTPYNDINACLSAGGRLPLR
jgi:micrococcal nuclease